MAGPRTHQCLRCLRCHAGACCCHAGEIKAELVKVLADLVGRHQATRAAVTEEVVDCFMAVRPMAMVADGKA